MSYKVTASDIGAVQLNETDTVRSVLQNIAIILSTRAGDLSVVSRLRSSSEVRG